MTSTRSRLRLGSCPDSWGVWFADDPAQTPWHRFLDELAEAGYRWLELGPYGYLPTDPARLRDEVDRRGLRVSGQAVFGALHDPDRWEADLRDARLRLGVRVDARTRRAARAAAAQFTDRAGNVSQVAQATTVLDAVLRTLRGGH
jgi:sugar phosphate isomerase/epimerase